MTTEPAPLFCIHGWVPDTCPRCHARRTDPDTSKAAAEWIPRGHAGHILAILRAAGPATQSEIAAEASLLPHQVNKRLADLNRKGLAEPTGATRTGHAGRAEREWHATR